jgi:ubiquitin-protein ligase
VIGGDWRPIHDLAEILKDIFDELSKEDRNAEEKNAKEQIEKEKKKNKGGK